MTYLSGAAQITILSEPYKTVGVAGIFQAVWSWFRQFCEENKFIESMKLSPNSNYEDCVLRCTQAIVCFQIRTIFNPAPHCNLSSTLSFYCFQTVKLARIHFDIVRQGSGEISLLNGFLHYSVILWLNNLNPEWQRKNQFSNVIRTTCLPNSLATASSFKKFAPNLKCSLFVVVDILFQLTWSKPSQFLQIPGFRTIALVCSKSFVTFLE